MNLHRMSFCISFFLIVAGSVSAQSTLSTETGLEDRDRMNLAIGFAHQDSVKVIDLKVEMIGNFPGRRFSGGMKLSVFKLVKYDSYGSRYRLTGDYLVAAGILIPITAARGMFGDSSRVARIVTYALLPAAVPLLQPAFGFKLHDRVRLFAGWDSEYSLFSYEDGISFRPRLGLEIAPHESVGIEAGVQQASFWSFEKSSRNFGWGWHVNIKLFPAYHQD